MTYVDQSDRHSRLAMWSSRLASLSIPVLVIAAIGHRSALLGAASTYASMALGFTLAALALMAAAAAFAGIWQDGRQGARNAVRGTFLGLLVLSLPAFAAWKLVTEPQLTDISTALADPPLFQAALAERGPGATRPSPADEVEAELQREAYPDVVSRFYPVGTPRVYDEASEIVIRRGWRILSHRSPSEDSEVGRIEAVASTIVFGFRQDVVIRIVPQGEGALVDMRSAARSAAHDLGANAHRIRSFLIDLDDALQGITSG